jgi:hypothetical protein
MFTKVDGKTEEGMVGEFIVGVMETCTTDPGLRVSITVMVCIYTQTTIFIMENTIWAKEKD